MLRTNTEEPKLILLEDYKLAYLETPNAPPQKNSTKIYKD